MTVEWPDTEAAVRTYLRAHADVAALFSTRVFHMMPDKPDTSSWPLVVVSRVGGFDDPSDAPVDQALIGVDVWGGFHLDGGRELLTRPDKAGCTAGMLAVRQAFADLIHTPASVTVGATTVRLDGGTFSTAPVYLPDPSDGRPRYSLTPLILARQMASA